MLELFLAFFNKSENKFGKGIDNGNDCDKMELEDKNNSMESKFHSNYEFEN
ncbi:MAG: hypothetical protein PHT02_00935 [Tissierellia bacterium]|nr:hypothetical protein [Tissierellia bacterium]